MLPARNVDYKEAALGIFRALRALRVPEVTPPDRKVISDLEAIYLDLIRKAEANEPGVSQSLPPVRRSSPP